jgi:sucrose phosphorylase
MKNQVQLITYVDRLGGPDIAALNTLLNTSLAGLFGGVHLLPFFYPIDGADAGFDPIDHTQVDPRLGNWQSIAKLAQTVDVMADVIVNHMSSDSPQFKDFLKYGSQSKYANLFLSMDSVFPGGATEAQLLQTYRPRPGLPFTYTQLENGEKKVLWTTFTSKQIDIAVQSPQGQAYLLAILDALAASGVSIIRLDACGYAIKKAGTSSFMIPETFAFIREFSALAKARNMVVLLEIHSYYVKQIEIAREVDMVYDFALPPLILHSFFSKQASALAKWLKIRPNNCFTVLDTHDGIGIIDIGGDSVNRAVYPGLVSDQELANLVEAIHKNSGGQSRKATGAAASNLDLYQVNCTFFDAMAGDELNYLLARAIQFFVPGIPQVYYVGLLAGHNDMALLEKSQIGRDINRHYYKPDEVALQVRRPVVQKLFELIRLRNQHPAFNGSFTFEQNGSSALSMRWSKDAATWIELKVDFEHPDRSTLGSSNGTVVEHFDLNHVTRRVA